MQLFLALAFLAVTVRATTPNVSGGTCDIDGCFDRCKDKYGSSWEDRKSDGYFCSKGCAKVTGGKIEDADFFCNVDPKERFDYCSNYCAKSEVSEDPEKQAMCKYGCGFWKNAPSPPSPPSPSPPSPSPKPGNLPDIPDVAIWVGFWGTTDYRAAYDVSSLVFDQPPPKDVDKYGGGGVRFLYPAFLMFCKEQDETDKCTLFDDYEDRWNKKVPKMTQLLQDGKIIGFSVGDERVCGGGGHGTSVADWEKMINTIRASFPDRRKAIIHANECGSTFGKLVKDDGSCINDDFVRSVPAGLDWISMDKYRHDDKPGFMKTHVKAYYKACIYPKMQSHQKVCINGPSIAPEEGSKPKISTILQDSQDTVDWAESDDLVGCITPYRWDDMIDAGSKYDEVKKFWSDYAIKTRPGMQNATLV